MIYCNVDCDEILEGDWGNLYPWATLECPKCGKQIKVRGVDYADFYGEPHQHMFIEGVNAKNEVTAFSVDSDSVSNRGIQMKYWDDKDCEDPEAEPVNANRIYDIYRAQAQVWASAVERRVSDLERILRNHNGSNNLVDSVAIALEDIRAALLKTFNVKGTGGT
jgi:hypothetical protein